MWPMTDDAVGRLASALSEMEVVDLSASIFTGMPIWFSHPGVSVEVSRTFERDGYFCQTVILPEHAGSHVDAPAHVRADLSEATVERMAPDVLLAPAWKVDVSGDGLRPGEVLTLSRFREATVAAGVGVAAGDVVLFEFGWDRYWDGDAAPSAEAARWWGANEPGLEPALCDHLRDLGARAVGSDTAGCDMAVADGELLVQYGHEEAFLPNGIPVVEGLHHLARCPRRFFFVAVPLRITGGSGSPLRPLALVPSRDAGVATA
jgi:arylformamidase